MSQKNEIFVLNSIKNNTKDKKTEVIQRLKNAKQAAEFVEKHRNQIDC